MLMREKLRFSLKLREIVIETARVFPTAVLGVELFKISINEKIRPLMRGFA